jgi:murein DD-endopeptidase MepM/ murein hydrolase activator NlpD
MSCGCKGAKATPEIAEAGWGNPAHVFMAPGETVDCYMARAGEQPPIPEGKVTIDKIANSTIASDCDLKVDVQFELTKGSLQPITDNTDPQYPGSSFNGTATWTIAIKEVDDEVPDPIPVIGDTGLSFSTAGKLSGTVNDAYKGKKITLEVKAKANKIASSTVEDVDTKTYVLLAEKCDKDTLKLIHPLPISGVRITGKYNEWREKQTGHHHSGIDYAASGKIGKIVAAADGEVVDSSGGHSGYGNLIKIAHKNSAGKLLAQTWYAHWSESYVKVGDMVKAGQAIALEGSAGFGSGPHLHFELRLPNGKPTDPTPYMNGAVMIDTNPTGDPGNPSGDEALLVQKNRGLTSNEIDAKMKCSESVPIGYSPTDKPLSDQQALLKGKCRPSTPPGTPSKQEFIDRMNAKLDSLGADARDKDYFLKMTRIECRYDAYAAAAPLSSALGPYQMLNATAGEYYAKIGVEPTCENRCNIEYATEAQWLYYQKQKRIYERFHSGAWSPPANSHTARYQTMPYNQFIYMMHHDGEGSVQKGRSLQGADIYAKNIRD